MFSAQPHIIYLIHKHISKCENKHLYLLLSTESREKKLVYFLKINNIYFIPRSLGLLPRNWTFLLSSYWFFRFVLTKHIDADKKRMFQSYDCLRAICTDRIYVRQHLKERSRENIDSKFLFSDGFVSEINILQINNLYSNIFKNFSISKRCSTWRTFCS